MLYISNVVIFGQCLIHLGMTEDLVILSFLFVMNAKSNWKGEIWRQLNSAVNTWLTDYKMAHDAQNVNHN